MFILEDTLSQELETKKNNKIVFEDLWTRDIDDLFREYDLLSETEEEDEVIRDNDWLIF